MQIGQEKCERMGGFNQEGAPISVKSSMHKTVALYVTEDEFVVTVSFAQDTIYTKRESWNHCR